MDDTTDPTVGKPASRARTKGFALAVGGLLVGGALAGTLTAAAATSPTPTTSTDSSTSTDESTTGCDTTRDESQPQHSDEELLTGDLLQQVTDVALAEYPGATINRVETDSDGVYEAHLTTADGERVTVEVGDDLAVTGVEAGGGPGGHGDCPSEDGSATGSSPG